jgi:hypothetical protein
VDWVDRIGRYKVEHFEMPRPDGKPYLRVNEGSGIGVLHTTENSSVEGAKLWLKQKFSAPHFITGEHRIVQCRPLWAQGAALVTDPPHYPNHDARVQIEQVTFSKTFLWKPVAGTLEPTAAVVGWCADKLGIPIKRPYSGWRDDGKDMPFPWAENNQRRSLAAAGGWPERKGWWHHMEVPWQGPSWHWDCGAYDRTVLFTMAKEDDMTPDEVRKIIADVLNKHRVIQFGAGIFDYDQDPTDPQPPEGPERARGWAFAKNAVADAVGHTHRVTGEAE